MKRYCFTLDLKNDPQLIHEYEIHHAAVWPEIIRSIKEAGIQDMQIYRVDNRLFMIMDTVEGFSFEQKQLMDQENEKVQEWERLMWNYQQSLPGAAAGEKWKIMNKIFQLTDYK